MWKSIVPGIVIFSSFLLPRVASAGLLVPHEDPKKPLQVRRAHYGISVKNQVVEAVLRQVFFNQRRRVSEATFLQRLPEGAAVSTFAFWVGSRRVESRVQEKGQAKKTYAAAKRAGREAGLLSQLSRDRFAMKVASLAPGSARRTELRYEGLLPYKDGRVTLEVPLAAPKGLEVPLGELAITIDIRDDKPITAVRSLSLPAKIERVTEKHWRVTLKHRGSPTRDLLLEYQVRSRDLGLTFLTHRQRGQDGYYMLLASPQELTTSKDIVKKDVVFVFDVSGSMQGAKISQARSALKRCLELMNSGDRFGIVAFSDGVNPLAKALSPLDTRHRREALAFVDKLEAGGGTNIDLALREGLRLLGKSDRSQVIVFLTDGEPTTGVTDTNAILEAAKRANTRRARIFAFGVGRDVNRTFLERLGRQQRGAVAFVERDIELRRAVAGFYTKIARPVLSELKLDFGRVLTAMSYPNVLPDLYKGSQLVLIGRYRGEGKMKVALSGDLNSAKKRYAFDAAFPKESGQNAFLARLWARRRIAYLLAQMRMHGLNAEAKDEVIRLAKRHHLATRFTSLVAAAAVRIASLSPARVKPGDPEIDIRAPRDARAVTVIFPFGVTKAARYEASRDLWSVRFLIPRGTADGTYPVMILITLASGEQKVFHVSYTVDTVAPQLKVEARGALVAGQVVTFAAKQIITERELRQSPGYRRAKSRRTRRLYARAMLDARSVTLRLPGGELVKLSQRRPGVWEGRCVVTAAATSALVDGALPVKVVSVDVAGNRREADARAEVR